MIEQLVDRMTLEEQVSLLSGADFWTTVAIERLGIPKIKVTDGPNGARGGGSLTGGVKSACFPCAISLGSTFSPDLLRKTGVALAEEAKTKSARVLLAPTVNIHRSGLNGRNFECYSEDPHLTSELATAYIEGVQSQGIAATIKHFVGNESEIQRQTISSDIDERALRELYLPPFEAAVKRSGVMAIMSSYNRLNGTYTSEHHWLLTELLREEWGFDGIVMSDWFGSHTTAETINAGLDLEMPGPARDRGAKLVAAVREGKVAAATVREAALRILRLLQRVGAFEDPSMEAEKAVDRADHRSLIRKLAAEGAVLLKNDGLLPIDKGQMDRLAVIGPNAGTARVMGGGSAQINAHYRISPLEGIRNALQGSNRVSHAIGCRNNRLTQLFSGPLTLSFFKGQRFEGPVIHRAEAVSGDFFWLDMPHPDLDPLDFSVRIEGSYKAEDEGIHQFGLANAGFAHLYVNGAPVIDGTTDWTPGDNFFGLGNNERRGSVHLAIGETVNFTVDFINPHKVGDGIGIRALRLGIEPPLGDSAIERAVDEARAADIAILTVGREGEWDTEGLDLPDMRLPGRQDELVERVAAVNPRTVVVLQTGGPIEMPWLDKVSAVLQMWYPGQELGNALADILFGDAEPGGRLPQSFPVALRDNSAFTDDPLTYPGEGGHVAYREGLLVGYRHHDRKKIAPLFPFGFGLSYTQFEIGAPQLSSQVIDDSGITIKVPVRNVGARSGSEVVQLYVINPRDRADEAVKELKAFGKIALASGEAGEVTLCLGPDSFRWFATEARAWQIDGGRYRLAIGRNAGDLLHEVEVELSVSRTIPVKPMR